MESDKSKKDSWQDELLDFIDDDFEKEVFKVAIKEQNPESILIGVKDIIRERLYEDKETQD